MAVVVKIAEKTTRFLIMLNENGGVPIRNDRIRSVPLLRGLSSANTTIGCGIIPSLPRVRMSDKG